MFFWPKMKQKLGINLVCGAFIVAAVVDLISTLRLGELVQYLEANLVYDFIGLAGISLINVLFVCLILWAYYKTDSMTLRFSIISSMVVITVIRAFVIIANWQIGNNPPTIEEAQAITKEVKNIQIWKVALQTFWPYILAMISFWFFQMDHKIEGKD